MFGNLTGYIDEDDATCECKFCGALFWFNERVKKDSDHNDRQSCSLCCLNGKVVLLLLNLPPENMWRLYFEQYSAESKNFYTNIR